MVVVSHLLIVEALLRRVDRFWDDRETLKGPGPAQDQQGNQSHGFVHPVTRVRSSVRCETLNRCEANGAAPLFSVWGALTCERSLPRQSWKANRGREQSSAVRRARTRLAADSLSHQSSSGTSINQYLFS